jgi:hypothetical protein
VTRKPTNDLVADGNFGDDDNFGSFFQRGWEPQPPPGTTRRRGGQYYQQVQPGYQQFPPRWW